jgi:hypothetical protein
MPPDERTQHSERLGEIVATRRLSQPGQGHDRRFTVAKTRALLELRARPQAGPWHWTIDLLRAANAVARGAEARVSRTEKGEELLTDLAFIVPGASFERTDLSMVLGAALEPDLGVVDGVPTATRWRRLVASAINRALAGAPVAVELATPVGGRVFERLGGTSSDLDPYRERASRERTPEGSFSVRVRARRQGLGGRLGAWLTGSGNGADSVTGLWHEALLGSNDRQRAEEGMNLDWTLPGRRVRLGHHAMWGAVATLSEPWLVRDGVRLLSLAPALARAGLNPRELPGWIDCPTLRRTADEDAVVEDAAMELLVAWLHDARAHTFEDDDGKPQVIWPTTLTQIPAASGRPVAIEEIGRRAREGADLLYVWHHAGEAVPGGLRARVLRLWPSERALLSAAVPDARLVPLRALGHTPDLDRVDLASLDQGSLEPVSISMPDTSPIVGDDGVALKLTLHAYVHRYPTATRGAIALLAFERRVSQLRDETRVIPGVTLVCRITAGEGGNIHALRQDAELLRDIADRCRAAAEARMEELLSQVFRRAESPWETPLVRIATEDLGGCSLHLRYTPLAGGAAGGRDLLQLRWRETSLLDLPIGRSVGGDARTLRDALSRLRDVGGIVVGEEHARWRTLESSEPGHEPWVLTGHGRDLLVRVLGKESLWEMPTVPEARPHVRKAAEQRGLLLAGEELERLRERSLADATAREALLAHLLVARSLGEDEGGLDEVALLRRYDARALAPTRLVSVADVLAEQPRPRLAFPGAVSRDLQTPVVEVAPGVAALLHEVLALKPSAVPRAPPRRSGEGERPAPVRRRGRAAKPLVSKPVAHPMLAGSLHVEPEGAGTGVAVWARGLHVGDVDLPSPLSRVTGRVWLTKEGIGAGLRRIETEVRGLVRSVVAAAATQRFLMAPGSERRDDLERFVRACRDLAARDAGLGLAEALRLPDKEPSPHEDPMRSLKRHPLHKLPPVPRKWLASLVRQALVLPVEVDTAWLSWRPARLEVGERGPPRIELGRRHDWVGGALSDEPDKVMIFAAACLAVADVLRQARAEKLAMAGPGAETVALYRLLAMAYVHLE